MQSIFDRDTQSHCTIVAGQRVLYFVHKNLFHNNLYNGIGNFLYPCVYLGISKALRVQPEKDKNKIRSRYPQRSTS